MHEYTVAIIAGSGWRDIVPTDINRKGEVVGYGTTASGYRHAFLFIPGSLKDLKTLGGGNNSEAHAINDKSEIVGVSEGTASGETAVRWASGSTIPEEVRTRETRWSVAHAINENGHIAGEVGPSSDPIFPHAFLDKPPALADDLGLPPYTIRDCGSYINNNDHVTGVADHNSACHHAFRWTPDHLNQDLPTLGGSNPYASSWPVGINDAGQIAGCCEIDDVVHAFLYSPRGGMRDLHTLGGPNSYATGINEQGSVIGYSDTSAGVQHAFLTRNRLGQDLMSDLGAVVDGGRSRANAVNGRGQIIGNSDGKVVPPSGPAAPLMTQVAFVYDEQHHMRDLNSLVEHPSPMQSLKQDFLLLTDAVLISETGHIVALGRGARYGWPAVPPRGSYFAGHHPVAFLLTPVR